MGQQYDSISQKLGEWLLAQPVYKDEYIAANNLASIDALPGLDTPTLTNPDLLPSRSSNGKAL